MEQVLLIFAIAVLIWFGAGASRPSRTTQPRGFRGTKHKADNQRHNLSDVHKRDTGR